MSGLLLFLLGLALGGLLPHLRRRIRSTAATSSRQLPAASPARGRLERLIKIAGLVEGTTEPVRSNFAGHVSWRRGGRRFYYYEQFGGGLAWGVVAVRHPKARLPAVQIRPRGQPSLTPPLASAYATPSGLAAFDQRMEILLLDSARTETNPIGPGVCSHFLTLDSLLPASPALDAHHSRARVSFPGVLSGDPACRLVLEEACLLLGLVLGEQVPKEEEAGMEYLDAQIREEGQDVVCGVCGEGILGDRTVCARCGTPHHVDCWRYTGGCTIFACQGKESR